MNSPFLTAARVFAIQLFFGITFFLSAWLKWSEGVPAWFVKQFQSSWLAHAPGGLSGTYYFLAVLETIGFLGCAASMVTGEFLPKAKPLLRATLTFALFIFIILSYGARLTAKFDIAAYNLIYFLGALICLADLSRSETSSQPTR